ncbi:cupredoxin domain-containing protein [Colwelliaceae bacterium 6441]
MGKLKSYHWGVTLLLLCFSAHLTAKTPEYHLTLEDHVFTPSELNIPANQKVKLIIFNKDAVVEEFDSFDLNREKVLFPKTKSIIFVGPLKAGKYEYFGEYHPSSARGMITVGGSDVN